MDFCACAVPIVPMRNWWRSLASEGNFVPRVVDDAWRRRLLTCLITSFPGRRCANGCSRFRFRCVIYSPPVRIHLAAQYAGDIPQLLLKLTALFFGHGSFLFF